MDIIEPADSSEMEGDKPAQSLRYKSKLDLEAAILNWSTNSASTKRTISCRRERQTVQKVFQRVCEPCNDASENSVAVSFCQNCRKYLCSECEQADEKLYRGKNKHNLISLTQTIEKLIPTQRKVVEEEDKDEIPFDENFSLKQQNMITSDGVVCSDESLTLDTPVVGIADALDLEDDLIKDLNKIVFEEQQNIETGKYCTENTDKHLQVSEEISYDAVDAGNAIPITTMEDFQGNGKSHDEDRNFGNSLPKLSETKRNDALDDSMPLNDEDFSREGEITKEPSNDDEVERSFDGPKLLSFYEEINVRLHEIETECDISDIARLRSGELVLVDTKNERIKIITTSGKTRRLQQFESWPWNLSVSCLKDNEVYITFPDLRKIAVINIYNKQVTIRRKIRTTGDCWGIACTVDGLIISLWDKNASSGTIQIIDFNGKVLEVFENDHKLGSFLNGSCYLAVNQSENMLCATDNESRTINVIERGENNLITRTVIQENNFGYLCGLALDLDENVYVIDIQKKCLHKVEAIADSYKSSIALSQADGLTFPRCVFFDKFNNLMYVGGYGDYVKVFKCILC